jgi:hypothetical protein
MGENSEARRPVAADRVSFFSSLTWFAASNAAAAPAPTEKTKGVVITSYAGANGAHARGGVTTFCVRSLTS